MSSVETIKAKLAGFSRSRSNALCLAAAVVIVPGLFGTVALPAYAYSPGDGSANSISGAAKASPSAEAAPAPQAVIVRADAAEPAIARDGFSATSAADMRAAAAAAAPAGYSGPTVSDYLANPPYPSFSLDQVVAVALQYQGVPYVYGGADPSGFDCSGFVMYVYAQFGISLPHGSGGQASVGTSIATSAALPGDVIIMDGHDGFYMGGGMILDAPQPGGVVSVRPLWTNDYYVVRFGI